MKAAKRAETQLLPRVRLLRVDKLCLLVKEFHRVLYQKTDIAQRVVAAGVVERVSVEAH